jgi:predicted TIM-barrel fold metal-dependent hydrolase
MDSHSPHIIIDFHAHVFPDELAARAIPQLEEKYAMKAHYDGTVPGLLASMRASKINRTVLQPVATKPGQVNAINHWSLSLRQHAGLIPFGALHPDAAPEQLDEQIKFLETHGFPGVKLHLDYQQFHPDEDRLEPFYQRLEQSGLVVLFHSGIDLGLYPPLMAGPEHIAMVHKAFPKLTLVVAHMGGYKMWDQVESYLVGHSIWLDTAFCDHECPQQQFLDIVRAHGADKVLFASDGPWGGQAENLAYLHQVGLSETELRAIEGDNARRLLGLD